MPYIVVPIDFFEKDKRMRKLMFRFRGEVCALPIRLLCLAAQESPRDGRLADHSTETLEVALGWTGRRGELEQALIEAEFLEKLSDGYRVLNWEKEQGHIWRNHVRASESGQGPSRKDYRRCWEQCYERGVKQRSEQKFPLLPRGLSPHPSLPYPLPHWVLSSLGIPVWL